ncbi:MAG: hypothetical protein V3T70_02640 [Phycisphaerae bacterium]
MNDAPNRPSRGIRPVAIALTAMAVLAAAAFIKPGRPSLPRRFAEVEPNQIYRGGYIESEGTVRRLIREHGIRTIISLTEDRPELPRVQAEQAVIAEGGLKYLNFPMPGNGCGRFDALDAAADALADESNYPLFYRCAAGKQRSNTALAAFRMKHEGWTIAQALAELDDYGLDRDDEAALCEHLTRYYETCRVRPKDAP